MASDSPLTSPTPPEAPAAVTPPGASGVASLIDSAALDRIKRELQTLRPYRVKLPIYEGPMDLLLFLVRRHEVDVYDIPMAAITEEYFEYIVLMEVLDIEVAGDFLVMATTLMVIKAKTLLPTETPDDFDDEFEDARERDDPRADLQRKLIEYQKFRNSAEYLRQRIERQSMMHPRGGDEAQTFSPDTIPIQSVSVFDLLSVFKQMLLRAVDDEPAVLERRSWTVGERMEEILEAVRLCPDGLSFFQTVSETPTKLEVIVTFLAVLELIRRRRVSVHQHSPMGEIRIYPGAGRVEHG